MQKKSEKNGDPKILPFRRIERETKQNLLDANDRLSVQLVSAPCRPSRHSVAVWWNILMRFWVKIFSLQGLIEAKITVINFAGKHQLWVKAENVATKWK